MLESYLNVIDDSAQKRKVDFWLPPGNLADLSIILSLPISFAVLAFEMEARALRGASVAERAVSASVAETGSPPPLEA